MVKPLERNRSADACAWTFNALTVVNGGFWISMGCGHKEVSVTDLKKLMPEDAKEVFGHGLRGKRSKSGAISFELMETQASDASL